MKLRKTYKLKNEYEEYAVMTYDLSTIQNTINFSINQIEYIKYSHLLYNKHRVKKVSFNDLLKLSLIREFYNLAHKDSNGYMIYNGNEFKEKYQLIRLISKILPSKYKNWGLLELSTEKKYNGKGAYKFTKLGENFIKNVLNFT